MTPYRTSQRKGEKVKKMIDFSTFDRVGVRLLIVAGALGVGWIAMNVASCAKRAAEAPSGIDYCYVYQPEKGGQPELWGSGRGPNDLLLARTNTANEAIDLAIRMNCPLTHAKERK